MPQSPQRSDMRTVSAAAPGAASGSPARLRRRLIAGVCAAALALNALLQPAHAAAEWSSARTSVAAADMVPAVSHQPEISTALIVGSRVSSAEQAATVDPVLATSTAGVPIAQQILYNHLSPGARYDFHAELVNKSTNQVIAQANQEETPDDTQGLLTVDFGSVRGLQPGASYVVFVRGQQLSQPGGAVTAGGAAGETVVDIADKNRTAQSLEVGTATAQSQATIATTVDNTQANSLILAQDEAVHLANTVKYEGLQPGQKYTVSSVLYDVDHPAIIKAIALREEAPREESGTFRVDFGTVPGLKAGHAYSVRVAAEIEQPIAAQIGGEDPYGPLSVANGDLISVSDQLTSGAPAHNPDGYHSKDLDPVLPLLLIVGGLALATVAGACAVILRRHPLHIIGGMP